jgi:copper transport protein
VQEVAPPELTLRFSEPVELKLGAISVFSCSGTRVDTGEPHHTADGDREVAVSLPSLAPDLYLVTWGVISADSHPIRGSYSFRIGQGSVDTSGCAEGAAANRNDAVGITFGVFRFLLYAGLALLIGGMTFLVAIARGTSAVRITRVLVWVGWFVTLISTVGVLLLQGPYVTHVGLTKAFDTSLLGDIIDTRFGHFAVARLVLLFLALPFIIFEQRYSARKPLPLVWFVGAIGVALLLSATPGLAGHAGTGDWTWLAIPMDAIHVAAMAVWMGGLVALIASALGGGFSGGLRHALIRFSAIATAALIVLLITGVFASWRQVGFKIDNYLDTSFGNMLLSKLAVVVGLIGVAAISRSIVRKRQAAPLDAPDSAIAAIDERTVEGLRQSVGVEVFLGVVILMITALLVQSIPARSAAVPKLFEATVEAGDGADAMKIDVSVDPARVGTNAVHFTTYDVAGKSLTVQEITASISNADEGIEKLEIPLDRAGPDHFINEAFPIPVKGTWKMEIHVLKSRFDDTTAFVDVPIY